MEMTDETTPKQDAFEAALAAFEKVTKDEALSGSVAVIVTSKE